MSVDITKVDFDQEIQIRNQVNLVDFFKAIPETQRAGYWHFDVNEYGFDTEWERPIAFVMAWLDDRNSVGGAHGPGISRSWVDENTWDNFYCKWEEDHFIQLCEAVPWLAPESILSPEDIARIPGPLDVPLLDTSLEPTTQLHG